MPRQGQRGVICFRDTGRVAYAQTPLCRFRDICPSRGEIDGGKAFRLASLCQMGESFISITSKAAGFPPQALKAGIRAQSCRRPFRRS